MRHPWSIVLAALPALPSTAGSVTVFLGPPGGAGSVRVLDELGLVPADDPAALQSIRLLDLDVVGRTALEPIDEAGSRRFEDVPGAARVRLANGHGSLYHFVRREGSTSAAYGYFLVDPAGSARVLLELPANAWNADPFLGRVAIARDGAGFLAATRLEDGGDLYEVEVVNGLVTARTAALPPLDFGANGLLLAEGFGAAVHTSGVVRFDRSGCDDATPVPIAVPTPPAWFARELVASANGAFAAAIAGADAYSAHPFVFGAGGPATCFCDVPTAMSGAGFLPYAINGPWLSVSDDGLACAWRVGVGHVYSKELWVAVAPQPAAAPVVQQLTRDELFEPYLDEVGVFVFTPTRQLLFAAGDPGTGGNLLSRMDLFRATIDPLTGATDVRNLSLTSGDAVPPFLAYPALAPERIAWSASANAYLLYDPGTAGGRVLRVAATGGGGDELLEHVTALDMLELAGDDILLAVRTVGETDGRGIQSVPADLAEDPEMVVPLSSAVHVTRAQVGPDRTCTYVTAQGANEFVWRLPPGEHAAPQLLSARPLTFGPAFAATPSGGVALSIGAPGGPVLFLDWPASGSPRRLQSSPRGGHVLPGH